MSNRYRGMSPFEIDHRPEYLIAILALEGDGNGEDRCERIRNAAAAGHARISLEVMRCKQTEQWYPVVTIELLEEVVVSEEELLYKPFNAQLGIRPQGLI